MATWDLSRTKHHVLICNGSSCMRKGGEEVTQALRKEINRLGLDNQIHTSRTRCNGRCQDACVVIVYPEGIWYQDITPNMAEQIVQQHFIDGQVLEEHVSHRYSKNMFVRSDKAVVGKVKP